MEEGSYWNRVLRRRLSRRRFLQKGALTGLGAVTAASSLGGLLSACAPAEEVTPTPAAVTPAPATPAPGPPIKLGFIAPTGFPAYAILAKHAIEGAKLAVEEIEAAGGILGRPLELVFRDDKADPAEGARQARDLIEREGVFALIYQISSAVALAISEVAREKKVPYYANVSSIELTADAGHRYVWRLPAHTTTQYARTFGALLKERGWRRIYWAGADYAWPQRLFKDLKDYIAEAWPEAEIVGEQWPKLGEKDYTPNLTLIAGAVGTFDVLLQIFIGGDQVGFTKQANAFGLYEKVKAAGITDLLVAQALKEDMPKGYLGNDAYPFWIIDNPRSKAFVEKFRAKTGEWPNMFAPFGYESVHAYAAALKRAGAIDREKMIDALDGLTLDTVWGKATIQGCDNQGRHPVYLGETDDVRIGDATYRLISKNIRVFTPEEFPAMALSCEEVAKLRKA